MDQVMTHLQPEILMLWSLYGIGLLGCVFGSLVASRQGNHTIATILATTVWAGAALPIALWSNSLPEGGVFINYPLGALCILGVMQAGTLLSTRSKAISY